MNDVFLPFAIETAQRAGKLLLQYLGNLHAGDIHSKSASYDLVTTADKASEQLIRECITSAFPGHHILGEEFGSSGSDETFRWFVDPLDGTTNFAHSHPFFAVSIALAYEQTMQLGVVYAPYFDEIFYATRGGGAYHNGKAIRVSTTSDLACSLLATGFPYKRQDTPYNNIDNFSRLLLKVRGIRRCGSAALELCFVASGRYDGFWELWLQPHDTAAGALIVREAGGLVTDWAGGDRYLFGNNIIASNGGIHQQIQSHLTPFPEEFWGTSSPVDDENKP